MGSKLSSSAASDIRSNDDNTNEVVIVSSNECTAGREFNQEINVTATNNSNEYGMMDVVSTTSTSGDETESVVSDDDEEDEERAQILADALALKQLAMDYRHPEIGVTGNYGARCYFGRPSAAPSLDVVDAEYEAQLLQDMMAMKAQAQAWRNPGTAVSVTVDPAVMGRNYFDRPSAPEQESLEESEARAQILADSAALKKLAVDYLHPEIGVSTTDATVMGRNYFDRPSAPEQESLEESEARAQILADSAALKKLAVDYLHPEIGVSTTDATVMGRNYFNRGSVFDTNVYGSDVTSANTTKERSESMASSHFEFDMEEHKDEFEEMKASLAMHMPEIVPPPPPVNTKTSDDEGSLSRSPSSVMLFGLDNSTAY